MVTERSKTVPLPRPAMATADVAAMMGSLDPLRPRRPNTKAFAAKRIQPRAFSIKDFRRSQAEGVPRLYTSTPTLPRRTYRRPGAMVERLFGKEERRFAVIQDKGERIVRSHWKGKNIAKRWAANKTTFAITDHSDARAVKSAFDMSLLTKRNLLSRGDLRRFEVCGPVLATAGHTTAEHADDPDIWNTCITGAKLWYLLDAEEWARSEGVGHRSLLDTVHFKFDTFMNLPSSRWAVVQDGNAFYCPNRFVHRVVTLRRYIGAGTFLVTPASRRRLMAYWERNGTEWGYSGEGPDFVEQVRAATL